MLTGKFRQENSHLIPKQTSDYRMTPDQPTAESGFSAGKVGLVVLLIVVATGALLAFRHVGRWLAMDDPLSRADVIFVLSGGLPYRAEEGAKVYNMGYAPEVWVSHPDGPAEKLQALGIHFVGEEDYNREILVHEGVPEAAVHILPDIVINTEQEVQEAVREMQRTGKAKIIIVTSPQHTRRVKAVWKTLAGDDSTLLVHAARTDPFDADHWWRNTRDISSVVRETLGLMNAWAGLPVPPKVQ
jgi:uncharacterized SAM-binding protein YcdF (DUF218 family)